MTRTPATDRRTAAVGSGIAGPTTTCQYGDHDTTTTHAGCIDMTDDETDVDDLATLRRRINQVDDYAKSYLTDQIEARDERIDELEDRVDRLEGIVLEVQDAVEGVAGLAKNERSTPDKRAADIRTALIRRAHGRDMKGAKMWWRQARDALLQLGHDDLEDGNRAKPLVHNAMEKAANGEGFELTSKNAECKDGVKREVKAIRVDLEDLPGSASGNEFTTVEGPTASGETINSAETMTNTSD